MDAICGDRVIVSCGKGRFSTVKFQVLDNMVFALKISNDRSRNASEMTILQNLQSIRCDNIIYVYDLVESDPCHLVLEACTNGSVRSYLSYVTTLSIAMTRTFMYEIILALVHLKRYNCLHRDLTAKNCLLSTSGHIKLSDFANSKLLNTPEDRAYTVVGSLHSMAPEVAAIDCGYGYEIDWWALAILCYETLIGMPPKFERFLVDGLPDPQIARDALIGDTPPSSAWHFAEVDEFLLYYPHSKMNSSYTEDQVAVMSFERIASLYSHDEQTLLHHAHTFIQQLLTINPTIRQDHINSINEHPWLLREDKWEEIKSNAIDLGDYCPYPELMNLLQNTPNNDKEHLVNRNDASDPFSNY